MPENSIRGFAWLIRPAPETTPAGAPLGLRYLWPIEPDEPGVHRRTGPSSYIGMTETAKAPSLEEGWVAEPVELDSDFDAPGVRLIRPAGEPGAAPPLEYIFEIAGE